MKKPTYEIERKFLIQFPDISLLKKLPGCTELKIEQIYLISNDAETARIRKTSKQNRTTYFLTFKKRITDLRCIEEETTITENEYNKRKETESDPFSKPILKTRYVIPYQNLFYEIDCYPFWNDRAILEIELKSEEDTFSIPSFLKVFKEVTNDKRYKNKHLSQFIPNDPL